MVTDRRRLGPARAGGWPDACLRLVEHAVHAGVELVQIRERDLTAGALVDLVRRCVELAGGSSSRIVVNERADVALAAGAGVHLRSSSAPSERLRTILPPGALLGRSVHDPVDARRESVSGTVDYLVFGTVFPTRSKSPGHRVVGCEGLAAAVRASRVPVVAIGGITVGRVADVAAAGAAGLAAIGMFVDLFEEAGTGPNSLARFADGVERLRHHFRAGTRKENGRWDRSKT